MTDRHPALPPGKSAVRVAVPPEPCFRCEATAEEAFEMVADALYTLCRGCMAKALRVQRGIARRGGDPPMREPETPA
jgi:hypothetical protein